MLIEVRAQSIFLTLPVLRHHDDRRLHAGDHRQHEVQHLIRRWIEAANENHRVEDDPKDYQGDRDADELPATAKLRDQISSAIGKSQTRFLFFVRVTRHSRAQQFVCASQPVRQSAEHLERDVRIAAHEREKRIARARRGSLPRRRHRGY